MSDKMYTETREKMNKAVKLYVVEKKEIPDIADELKTSIKTVYLYLKTKGVILRPRKRNNRGQFLTS